MRILIFQHVAVEHPGIFRQFWHENDDSMHTVELDAGQPIPDFDNFDLLMVMGGPMDVWQDDSYPWLQSEKTAIRNWVMDLDRPFIGICLGHQLLAAALGGAVKLMDRPEIGIGEVTLTEAGRRDPLFSGFESQVETFQWHGAEISQLPDRAEILAENSACPVQAFRWGAHAYGLQYHVEIVAGGVALGRSLHLLVQQDHLILGLLGEFHLGFAVRIVDVVLGMPNQVFDFLAAGFRGLRVHSLLAEPLDLGLFGLDLVLVGLGLLLHIFFVGLVLLVVGDDVGEIE